MDGCAQVPSYVLHHSCGSLCCQGRSPIPRSSSRLVHVSPLDSSCSCKAHTLMEYRIQLLGSEGQNCPEAAPANRARSCSPVSKHGLKSDSTGGVVRQSSSRNEKENTIQNSLDSKVRLKTDRKLNQYTVCHCRNKHTDRPWSPESLIANVVSCQQGSKSLKFSGGAHHHGCGVCPKTSVFHSSWEKTCLTLALDGCRFRQQSPQMRREG